MGLLNWFDNADRLNAIHKGNRVLSHPITIQEDEEAFEEEQGRKAHAEINALFASLDEEVDEDE